ncbi:MAG: flagellar assembly protein FliH [Alphaproteobacteria bacterium]
MSEKFLFDTSFEAEDLGDEAVQPVRKPPPPKFNEEDLERARMEGHAAGKEIAAQEAMRSIEQQISQAVNAVTTQMSGLAQAQIESRERQGREAHEVALTVVRKIFPSLAERNGLAEVESVVRDCLERLRDEPRIVIRVADAVLDRVEARIGDLAARAGFEGKIVYLAQDGLNPGDVRVEWADGGAERDSERLWREIDQITARVASPDTPEAPDTPPAGPTPNDAVVSA